MAGESSRFFKAGFKIPKYLIEVKGKTLLEHSVNSLPDDLEDEIIFIVLKEHNKCYKTDEIIKRTFEQRNIRVLTIERQTRGQSETVFLSRKYVDEDEQLLIYNIDTCFISSSLKKLIKNNHYAFDGILGSFISANSDTHWSFAKLNSDRIVIEVKEKEKISNHALTGLYHFSKANDFFRTAEYHIKKNLLFKNEFYIAPLYNDLIKIGKKYIIDIANHFIPLGTPEEVARFEKS